MLYASLEVYTYTSGANWLIMCIYAISSKISMERWEICMMYCVNYYESPPVLKVGLSKTQVKQVKVKNITFIRKGLEID